MSKEYAGEMSNEKLATDRWENEGGHTELQSNGSTVAAVPPKVVKNQRR